MELKIYSLWGIHIVKRANNSVELISSTIRLNNRYYASTETMRNTFHTEFFAPMADMEEQELLQYVQTPWVNRLLNLIKTDGKLPNYNKMLEIWVWPELCSGDEQTLHTSAETLDRMWSFSPQYYALARLLFFVCKQLYAHQATHTPNGSDELIRWLYKAELQNMIYVKFILMDC